MREILRYGGAASIIVILVGATMGLPATLADPDGGASKWSPPDASPLDVQDQFRAGKTPPSHAPPVGPVAADHRIVHLPGPLCTLIESDAGGPGDAGGSAAAARPIALGTHHGCIGLNDLSDWYRFGASAGQAYIVTLTPPTDADHDLYLTDCGTTTLDFSIEGTGAVDEVQYVPGASGDLCLRVERFSGFGEYRLDLVAVTPACSPNDDAGSSRDAASGSPVGIGIGAVTGCLDDFDGEGEDWFALPLSSGDAIDVTLVPPTCADFDLYLVDPAVQFILRASFLGGCATESFIFQADEAGTYFLVVVQWDGEGTYALTATAASPACGGAAQDDAGSGGDARFPAPVALPTGPNTGCLDVYDVEDWFTVTVLEGASISATLTPPTCADFDLYLLDDDFDFVDFSENFGCDEDSVSGADLAAGAYYLVAVQYEGEGTYTLTLA